MGQGEFTLMPGILDSSDVEGFLAYQEICKTGGYIRTLSGWPW